MDPMCVNVCTGTSPSGGVQFCSAAYRLFKVNPSEQSKEKDTVMEVQYKGEGVKTSGCLAVCICQCTIHYSGCRGRDCSAYHLDLKFVSQFLQVDILNIFNLFQSVHSFACAWH